MKKFLQFSVACLVSCLMIISVFAFVACDGNPAQGKDSYTVIVKKPDGTGYKGLEVEFKVKNTDAIFTATTDAAGKAVVKPDFSSLEEGTDTSVLEVSFKNLEKEYSYDGEITVKANQSVTVNLKAEAETSNAWTIIVLKPDGTPYSGVQVQLCTSADLGGICFLPVTTDAEGKAVIAPDTESDTLLLHFLPEGKYDYDNENAREVKRGETVTVTLAEKTAE